MLYSTKNSVDQCRFRPVTQITTVALARQFSVNGLQDLDFLTASYGRGSAPAYFVRSDYLDWRVFR